jgi:ADP-heptose:LPS heptosyltransferase
MSPPSFIRNRLSPSELAEMARKYVFVCQKSPGYWRVDHSTRLKKQLPEKIYANLLGLSTSSGPIRFRKFGNESVVEMTLAYMREKMGLERVEKNVELNISKALHFRKKPERIVISPDSAGPPKKNWTPGKFLNLARKLKKKGYDPQIVVAPAYHEKWRKICGNIFPTPIFPSIKELAAFIYESGVVISNDSGNGHLASFIGVPTITIYRKRNPLFAWRPDWRAGVVVCPKLILPLFKDMNWKLFVSIDEIIYHTERLAKRNDDPRPAGM